MANLKRNMIELVKNPDEVLKGGEAETEKYWTTPFLPMDVTYEAMDLMDKIMATDKDENASQRDLVDLLVDFTVKKIYGGQFTVKDLKKGLHAPDAITTLQGQVMFVAQGQQSDETKKFLAKKR